MHEQCSAPYRPTTMATAVSRVAGGSERASDAAAAAAAGPTTTTTTTTGQQFPADPQLEQTFRRLLPKINESLDASTYRVDNLPQVIASIANLVERVGGLFYGGEDKRKLVYALYQVVVEQLRAQLADTVSNGSAEAATAAAAASALLDTATDPQFFDSFLAVIVGISKGQYFWQKRSFWGRVCPCCCRGAA